MSTAKVFGEVSLKNRKIRVFDTPNPSCLYASSKLLAERRLLALANGSNVGLSIVRLPIVYGQFVKGNIGKIIQLAKILFPNPSWGIRNNRRAAISVDNTIDFIQHILAKNQKTSAVHLICDDECLSTTELLNSILKYSGVRKFLIPIPEFVLKFILSFL